MSKFMQQFLADYDRVEIRGPSGELYGVEFRPTKSARHTRPRTTRREWLGAAILISIFVLLSIGL